MPKPAASARREPSRPVADPDLVDRLFEFLRDHPHLPDFPPDVLDEIKADLRSEFRGEEAYIAACPPTARQERAAAVLRLFNGQNASEVARKLGIGRATVFRVLKQSGRSGMKSLFRVDEADRLTFPGNETPPQLPSDDA